MQFAQSVNLPLVVFGQSAYKCNVLVIDDFKTPGQLVKHFLEERGWSQQSLAIVLDIDQTGLNKLITGKRPITAELALLLSEVFDVEAERFLDLQKTYELAQARIVSRPDPKRATRATLFGDLPIAEMIKRGWLSTFDVRDTESVERELIRFFGVKKLAEIEVLPHAAKRTHVSVEATPAQLAWIYRVKQLASQMIVGEYTPFAARSAIKQLGSMLDDPSKLASVPKILTDCGIRFVIVESLASAKIDGVCFWLDSQSPVIGMSLRLDRIDNFWFVLRHECEHLVRGHGKHMTMLDAELEGERAGIGPNVTNEERVANEAAANFCIPSQDLQAFIKRKSPFISERDLLGFANTYNVHPGIAVGQLQHKTSRYDLFRNHLIKIRSIVTQKAKVDGWGLVAPLEA